MRGSVANASGENDAVGAASSLYWLSWGDTSGRPGRAAAQTQAPTTQCALQVTANQKGLGLVIDEHDAENTVRRLIRQATLPKWMPDRPLFFAVMLLVAASTSCAESRFELSQESRLPRWFTVPADTTRADIRVTMEYYSMPSGRTAVLTLWDKHGRRLGRVTASKRGERPATKEGPSEDLPVPYPMFEVLSAGDIVELIEHRRMEPVFFVSDDIEVKRKLGIIQ